MKKRYLLIAFLVFAVGTVANSYYREMPIVTADVKIEARAPEWPPTTEGLLTFINKERAKVGVAPLVIDERLNSSATRKATELISEPPQENPHINSKGVHGYEYISEAGMACASGGENLAVLREPKMTTSQLVVKGWMNSKPHREAILDAKSKFVGFGYNFNAVAAHFCG